jgi:hypothetical protein
MRPKIWTLADVHLTHRNPVWAGLADKSDQLEKPATMHGRPRFAKLSLVMV